MLKLKKILKPIIVSKTLSQLQNRRKISGLSSLVDLHPEIKDGILTNKPIVALESTIITHGMPYPHNFETAIKVEEVVRNEGSIPATIAIIDGRIKIGLSKAQFERLSEPNDNKNIIKCSRRDLAYVISNKLCGGTTVAGTLIIANMIGIKVFATGGIGGVHREGHETLDVSADLIELGRTPIAVISSGIKSILDIPRTLEYLETQGVCVASYQSPECNFPAFYTRLSGSKVPYNFIDAMQAANLIQSSLEMNLKSGILIGVPIPEKYAIDDNLINDAIENALFEAKKKNISGKEVTPFILSSVSKITDGKSLNSNIGLIKNNAMVASQIAVELHKILSNNQQKIFNENLKVLNGNSANSADNKIPTVVGASILDLCLTVKDDFKLNGATYEVTTKSTAGGVGRNLAEGIYKLYGSVNFITAVGNDEIGKNLLTSLPENKKNLIAVINDRSTSICNVIFDNHGDSKIIFGDMEIHQWITPELIIKNERVLSNSPLLIMDANLSIDAMGTVLEVAEKYQKPVFFEPTDMRCADKPFNLPKNLTKQIKFISPNIYEAQAILRKLYASEEIGYKENLLQNSNEILENSKTILSLLANQFDCILLTLSEYGVITAGPKIHQNLFNQNYEYLLKSQDPNMIHFKAKKIKKLINVSGAGDSFTSGFITSMLNGYPIENCVHFGFYAANQALKSEGAVPTEYFTEELLKNDLMQMKAIGNRI